MPRLNKDHSGISPFSRQRLVFGLWFLAGLIVFTPTVSAQDFWGGEETWPETVTVVKVINVDLWLLDNNKKVRLIGLKVPFSPNQTQPQKERDEFGFIIEPDSPVKPFEERALISVKRLVEGRHLRLESDEQAFDENHHSWVYAFLDDTGLFLNAEILRLGLAHLSLRPPNMKYAPQLREAYQEARREKRGLQGEY